MSKVLIYLLRRDLRLQDNPILHEIGRLHSQSHAPFTHVLPVYVFPAHQVEISGFLSSPDAKSPYPESRSAVGNFWRCGTHRSKFLAESVWDLKKSLEDNGSGLLIRVGMLGDVVRSMVDGLGGKEHVSALWMTAEPGVEEKREERDVRNILEKAGVEFKLWRDEKYFVDDEDLPYNDPSELPDVFTSFKKQVEPLREAPRRALPKPTTLPPFPDRDLIPKQFDPFTIPSSLPDLITALHKPLTASPDLKSPPKMPSSSAPATAHPYTGGETEVHKRLHHLITSGCMTAYKDTRNGLLGPDFSTKLSAWLALGCLSARQVHWALLAFEDGSEEKYAAGRGYGKGENKGTAAVRFELLWRDYFRLVTRKFGPRMFHAAGCRGDESIRWQYDDGKLQRWLHGTTGMGLVDASQRELWLTGYTSNRTRQNVASYLSKHLNMDWRLGAEWYECHLVDYDVGSNWGNWQYNSGVGNDAREGGMGRKFNPVKQGHDYDKNGEYVKAWIAEVRGEEDVQRVFQYGEEPLTRIEFKPGKGGGYNGRGRGGHKGRGGRGGKHRGSGRQGFSKQEMQ